MAVTGTMSAERAGRYRCGALALAMAGLLLTPFLNARADDAASAESSVSRRAKSFGAAVKRDSKVMGASCKEGAHRVAVAAKAVAHEIATAAKRGAAETRAAFRGEHVENPVG